MNTPESSETWFQIEKVSLPLVVPTFMPVVVPGIVPFIVPVLMPHVIPVTLPIVLPTLGLPEAPRGGTPWAPVPIEVVPDEAPDSASAQAQPVMPPVPQPEPQAPSEPEPEPQTSSDSEVVVSLDASEIDAALAPNPQDAPNFPINIVSVNKQSEIVTLQNISGEPVNLTGWKMISVRGNQVQRDIEGTLAPDETKHFANMGKKIWNNDQRDDGALYNAEGQLVSYWQDQG